MRVDLTMELEDMVGEEMGTRPQKRYNKGSIRTKGGNPKHSWSNKRGSWKVKRARRQERGLKYQAIQSLWVDTEDPQ